MCWTVRRALLALTVVVAACGDGTSPPKPSAVVFVSAPPASSQVGAPLPSVTIVVKDEKGNAMSGQPLTITVNGGTLTGAPTSTQGTTSIGTWTLAGKVGTNTITITSGSLRSACSMAARALCTGARTSNPADCRHAWMCLATSHSSSTTSTVGLFGGEGRRS